MLEAHLIINVFNGEEFLSQTLESLVHQGYEHVFIHCFDNHSTDKTSEIICKYKKEFNNIRSYYTPSHIPLVEARNHALSTVKNIVEGPFYFAFCDADDLCALDWTSKLMVFAELNYDIVICNGYIFDESEKYTPVNSCLSQWRPSPFTCPVFIRSCMFSSEILKDEIALFDKRFPIAYDSEFWLRNGNNLSMLHISDRLFHKRIHSNSMVHNNFLPILRERWGMLKKHNLPLTRFLYGFFRQLINMVLASK